MDIVIRELPALLCGAPGRRGAPQGGGRHGELRATPDPSWQPVLPRVLEWMEGGVSPPFLPSPGPGRQSWRAGPLRAALCGPGSEGLRGETPSIFTHEALSSPGERQPGEGDLPRVSRRIEPRELFLP